MLTSGGRTVSPARHLAVSAASGAILTLWLHSWVAGITCTIVGVFVDIDHFLDFWLTCGFSLNLKRFLDFSYYGTSRRFLVIFHAYEYIPVCLWLATFPEIRYFGWGLTSGYVLHLLCDQVGNRGLHRYTYFLSYRLVQRFEFRKLVLRRPFELAREPKH